MKTKIKYSIVARLFFAVLALLFLFDLFISIQIFFIGGEPRIFSILLASFMLFVFVFTALKGNAPFGIFERAKET